MPVLKRASYHPSRTVQAVYGMVHVLALLIILLITPSRSLAQSPDEYQLKAVFIYNFLHFTDWPPEVLKENAPIIIGIAGNNVFGNYLEETVRSEIVKGHSVEVRYFPDPTKINETTHVLFIEKSAMSAEGIKEVLGKSNPQLTVGDDPNFIKSGGVIRFFTHEGKIKFEINNGLAEKKGLLISSKLLRLANPK